MIPTESMIMLGDKYWWPICQKCGKPVSGLEIKHPPKTPGDPGLVADCIRRYTVYCHGEREEHLLGIWAAIEIAQSHRRLPDAFQKYANKL